MIDEQHAPAGAGSRRLRARRRLHAARAAERVEEGRRLEARLLLLDLRIGVVEQRRADPDLGDAVLDADRAQGQAGVQVAVEADEPDGAAVPGARRALVVLDELHRPRLGRSGDGHRPRVREERVEGVEAGPQAALDVIDGVNQARVHLDLAPPDHLHAPGHADARLVVAVHVRAHRQLGLVLGRVEQRDGSARRRRWGLAARDRAGDGTRLDAVVVDTHVHLRRGADQVLASAEVHEEPVGRGIALAQAQEQLGRGAEGQGSKNVWPGTTSKRSPRVNASRARRTIAAYSPGSWSGSARRRWPPT